jgi:hypothetical protein
MDPKQLAKLCVENINACNQAGWDPKLSLKLPEGNPMYKYRAPFGPKGPKGKIVQWGIPEGFDTCIFDTLDLLAYLVACGVVEIVKEKDAQP